MGMRLSKLPVGPDMKDRLDNGFTPLVHEGKCCVSEKDVQDASLLIPIVKYSSYYSLI